MPRETTGLFDDLMRLLVRAPAWLGPLLAVALFVGLRHLAPMLLPRLDGTIPVGEMLARMLPSIAWVAVGLVLAAWIAAEIAKLRQRRLLDHQQGLETIRALTWRQLEQLVAEAYRRRGYRVELVDRPPGISGEPDHATAARSSGPAPVSPRRSPGRSHGSRIPVIGHNRGGRVGQRGPAAGFAASRLPAPAIGFAGGDRLGGLNHPSDAGFDRLRQGGPSLGQPAQILVCRRFLRIYCASARDRALGHVSRVLLLTVDPEVAGSSPVTLACSPEA